MLVIECIYVYLARKQNPAPGSNIHEYVKKQKKEQRKINKQKERERQQALKQIGGAPESDIQGIN